MNRPATAIHLVRRFLGSVRPGAPAADDEAWAETHLLEGELALWRRMSNPDRRHAVGVARAVVTRLGGTAPRPVVAAALLHDVGKVVSSYRTPARVVATVVWALADDQRAHDWLRRRRPWRRLAQYRLHPQLGAELIRGAGGDALTAAWAAEHHRSPEHWTVPEPLATVLKDCDDD